jgi:peptide/nickel transport system permease protein
MLNYVLRRVLHGVFVLLAVLLITFSLPYFQTHGTRAICWQILHEHATLAGVAVCAKRYGLDASYLSRFITYVGQVLFHFNLGHSYVQNMSVNQALSLYIPRTIWLALVSLVLAIVVAIPLGVAQAWRRNSTFDYSATGVVFILYAMPAFLLCILAIDAFSIHWLHLQAAPPDTVAPWAMFTDPSAFILPVLCLTALSVAGLSRFMRSSVLDVLVQEYTRTAKAKGCSTRRVLFRHTMRNALGPIVVIIGLFIPTLLGGALIVEEVFNYPGMGYETVNAAQALDLPIIMGVVIIATLMTVGGNLLADLGLVMINPRIRIEGSAR